MQFWAAFATDFATHLCKPYKARPLRGTFDSQARRSVGVALFTLFSPLCLAELFQTVAVALAAAAVASAFVSSSSTELKLLVSKSRPGADLDPFECTQVVSFE